MENEHKTSLRKHPDWIKVRLPAGENFFATRAVVRERALRTVCEDACCPNIGECWTRRTATFMLMGDRCTRRCGFCAVAHGRAAPLDPDEPQRVAAAATALGLRHVVITSVNRDDLSDGGAAHFATTVRAIKAAVPDSRVEVLVPDFRGKARSVDAVASSPVDVFNHNTETVPRLYGRARPGARYERSLAVLERAKRKKADLLTKSGLMLGLGEDSDEVRRVLMDLRAVGCDILTLGQYLRPSKDHLPVTRYVPPQEFAAHGKFARGLGFRHVEAGPLVRSSYHAGSYVP